MYMTVYNCADVLLYPLSMYLLYVSDASIISVKNVHWPSTGNLSVVLCAMNKPWESSILQKVILYPVNP